MHWIESSLLLRFDHFLKEHLESKRTPGKGYKNGIGNKILYPNMNIWIKNGQLVQGELNKFYSKIQQFLFKATTTYSLNEIQSMVTKTVLVETKYINYLYTLLNMTQKILQYTVGIPPA